MGRDLRAPIFTVTWDLGVWLLKKARKQPDDPLAQALRESVGWPCQPVGCAERSDAHLSRNGGNSRERCGSCLTASYPKIN